MAPGAGCRATVGRRGGGYRSRRGRGPLHRDRRPGHPARRALPIRVTVQFYKATSDGIVTESDMQAIADQIDRVYEDGDYVGSLVVDGPSDRPPSTTGQRMSLRAGGRRSGHGSRTTSGWIATAPRSAPRARRRGVAVDPPGSRGNETHNIRSSQGAGAGEVPPLPFARVGWLLSESTRSLRFWGQGRKLSLPLPPTPSSHPRKRRLKRSFMK